MDPKDVYIFFKKLNWTEITFSLFANKDKNEYHIPTSFAINSIVKSIILQDDLFDPNAAIFHIPNRWFYFKPTKGSIFNVNVMLTGRNKDLGYIFIERLNEHFDIENNNKNYSLINEPIIKNVCFEDIVPEYEGSLTDTEFTLQFLYPLHFKPLPKRTRLFIDSPYMFKMTKSRFERLFSKEFPQINTDKFSLLPYYWQYAELKRMSKSQEGNIQYVNGCIGNLYIRGDLTEIFPYLVLGSKLHFGAKIAYGYGYFKLHTKSISYFNNLLKNIDFYKKIYHQLEEETDDFEEAKELKEELYETIFEQFNNGTYENDPVKVFYINKTDGSKREIHKPCIKDMLAHKILASMIEKPLDNAFEEESIGYRKGYGRHRAAEMINKAVKEGYKYVIESDIEDFFPSVDHEILRKSLENHIPRSDYNIIDLIMKAVQTKIPKGGKYEVMTKGLSQGSPLSPLLANIYLDSFDEMMKLDDLRLIRYADDFVILIKDIDKAEEILENAKQALTLLNLKLKKEKTNIIPIEKGFTFLGFEFYSDGISVEKEISDNLMKKLLFVSEPFTFIGVRGERVEVRKGSQTLLSVPLRRISEIVLVEKCAISSYLVKKCCDYNIPISMTLNSGYYMTTIKSDKRSHFKTITLHSQRYSSLSNAELLEYAKEIAYHKILNYSKMLKTKRAYDEEFKNVFYVSLEKLKSAKTQDEVRGVEGYFSKEYFKRFNRMVNIEEFKLTKRERFACDRMNPLLNFGYYLLFTRINGLARAVGLNPFLGFLHSPENKYESLVADIQELFRPFVDRFILRIVNTQIIKPEDFMEVESRYYLTPEARKTFLANYERDFNRNLLPLGRSILDLINKQIKNIFLWVKTGSPIKFFRWE